MGGLLVLGIILTLLGMSIMSGLMSAVLEFTGGFLMFGGIAAAVAGGAAVLLGSAISKVWGVGLILVGFIIAVLGIIMKFVNDLWFVQWMISFGGMVMLVIGIALALVGLIGLVAGVASSKNKRFMDY